MALGRERLDVSYVLPVRRWAFKPDPELAQYLGKLADRVEVIVVDGSDTEIFGRHASMFAPQIRHLPVDPDLTGAYGKVKGVITGVRAASHERVIVADDDVRYGDVELDLMVHLLDQADLVRPQNYFDPQPWHAYWDTARTLLNRCFGADYPGTLGVRRSRFLEVGGYDADCLFENLELIRTIEAAGGTLKSPLDLYVRRLPSTTRHFWSQRVRQAYDDFALPLRMTAELAVLPVAGGLLVRRRLRELVLGAALTVALAELGRRRAGGTRVFPLRASLLAPAWVSERAVCAWLAVGTRLTRGGVPYAGTVLAKSATSRRELRRRFAAAGGSVPQRRCGRLHQRPGVGPPGGIGVGQLAPLGQGRRPAHDHRHLPRL